MNTVGQTYHNSIVNCRRTVSIAATVKCSQSASDVARLRDTLSSMNKVMFRDLNKFKQSKMILVTTMILGHLAHSTNLPTRLYILSSVIEVCQKIMQIGAAVYKDVGNQKLSSDRKLKENCADLRNSVWLLLLLTLFSLRRVYCINNACRALTR